jgi:DNA polymerase-3 subunit delta
VKLGPKDMAGFLANPERYRAVLVYGPDEGLIRERRKAVLEKVCDVNDPFALTELAGDQVEKEPQKLYESLASFSLIGRPPVVWLRDGGGKVGPIILDALSEPKGNFLLITAGELDSRNALRKAFEDRPELATLACYADEAETLERVIRGFFAKENIRCTPEALLYLRQHLGNDRGVTLSELEKIALYLGDEKELTPEALEVLVNDNTLLGLDDLAYALAEQNLRQLYSVMERMLQEDGHPVALLRGMVRTVERLLTARTLMAQGKTAEQAMQSLRPPVFFKEKDRMRRALAKRSVIQLETLLAQLLAAERRCKRGGDVTLTFQRDMVQAARA